jgi:hypothetical protein
MKYYLDMNSVPEGDIEDALREYELKGDPRARRVFTLTHPSGAPITDERTFYDAVLHTFPLDPPMLRKKTCNWGALQDSLHGGLESLEEELIDIVWPDVHAVAKASIPTLVEGVLFLLRATDHFTYFLRGRKNAYTRILLVYEESHPGFAGFWFPRKDA